MIFLGEILIQREKIIMARSKWEMPEMEEKKKELHTMWVMDVV